MSKYIIGVDGGATKTIARIISIDNENQTTLLELTSGSCSLTQNFTLSLKTVKKLVSDLLNIVDCPVKDVTIAMGLAGAGNEILKQKWIDDFLSYFGFNNDQLTVTTDAITSLIGANNGQAAVCLALGTGSVAMSLDDKGNIKQYGGWGASISDEGGAVFIGKQAVRSILWDYDISGAFNAKLSLKLSEHIGQNRTQILTWLSKAKALDFANLSPYVTELRGQCELADKVFSEHIKHVEFLANTALDKTDFPLFLLGGLAKITSPYLNEELRTKLQLAKGNSVDGACILARKNTIKHGLIYNDYKN